MVWKGQKREVESRGGQALVLPTDVNQFERVQAAADLTERDFGLIDLRINNAMVSMYSPFVDMSPDEFRHIFEVTFLGTVFGTRCALQRMMPRDRGVIIQVVGFGLPLDPPAERLLRQQARNPGLYRICP